MPSYMNQMEELKLKYDLIITRRIPSCIGTSIPTGETSPFSFILDVDLQKMTMVQAFRNFTPERIAELKKDAVKVWHHK